MTKKTCKSWIQCTVTGKLIPRDEYVRPSRKSSAMVMGDIKPFVSTVTGEVISTRPQLEQHNKDNNVTNTADFSKEYVAGKANARLRDQAAEGKRDRIDAIQRAIHQQERR
jgi:hypothetical protein